MAKRGKSVEFVQKYHRLVILFIIVLIIFFLFAWMGFYEYLGLDGMNIVIDAIIFLPLLFAVVTMYYEHDKKLELDDNGIRKLMVYDLIYMFIGLTTGLVFVILYFIIR